MRFGLINMPVFSYYRPSIQLARISAQLKAKGASVELFFPNLNLAHDIGPELYDHLSDQCDILFGHWLFSSCLSEFPQDTSAQYLAQFRARLAFGTDDWEVQKQRLIEIRSRMPGFIAQWRDQVDWSRFDFVGFTCTFSQIVASLALAKEIKKKHPKVRIVIGGAEVQEEMGQEVLKHCDFIDHLVNGEGELAVLELLDDKPLPRTIAGKKAVDLAILPPPDYDEFFAAVGEFQDSVIPVNAHVIPIEGSRGCWWGQKHHCKFCGLNGTDLTFRSRSAEQILGEIAELSNRYERYSFEFVDNIIDYKYFRELLPQLSDLHASFSFFCETKANLRRQDLAALKASGFDAIQPGVESLNSEVLKIMDKGVKGYQNIDLLKFASELGMKVIWNMLYGFPGETEEQYQEMLALIEMVPHLEPPGGSAEIRIDRFSPYHKEIRDKVSPSFDDVRPADAYKLIYPADWDLWKLAYFFEGYAKNEVRAETYQALNEAVARWNRRWKSEQKPILSFRKAIDHGHIVDHRGDTSEVFKIEGLPFAVALLLDESSRTVASIAKNLNQDEKLIEEIIADFCELKICVRLDGRIVWLPTCKRPAVVARKEEPVVNEVAANEYQTKARAMAHDLRSPLTALQVVLDKASDRLEPNLQALLSTATKRFQKMADDFQSWAKR